MKSENSDPVPAPVDAQNPVNSLANEAENSKEKKSTGPRTAIGKRISSRNAMKHGAFSKEIILEHIHPHDRKIYTEFLRGLLETFEPHGVAEQFQVELMAQFRYSYLCVLRLRRALRGDATRDTTKDVFVAGCDSDLTERWRLDLPPLEMLRDFHRAENHCLHHYHRAAAELERLQRMRAGEEAHASH
jgi:hypothetical protein